MLIIIIAGVVVYSRRAQKQSAQDDVSITWQTIHAQNIAQMQSVFAEIKPIFLDAFLPMPKAFVYTHDPRVQHIPAEQKSLIDAKVTQAVLENSAQIWAKKIHNIETEAAQNIVHHLAIARDTHNTPLGFALFKEGPIAEHIKAKFSSLTSGSIDQIIDKPDQIYLSILAVKPGIQKKGLGKSLAFSIFRELPHITTLYLSTPAAVENENAQKFYEHIGFKEIARGTRADAPADSYEHKSIIYRYTKP